MSGAINTVGKIFNSTAGRVVTGIATGGASEIGRAVSGVARRSGVDPAVSAGIGYLAGSRESGASTAGGLGSNNPSPVGPAKAGGVAAAAGSVNTSNNEAQKELDQAIGTPSPLLTGPPPIDVRAEESASRRRAEESSRRVGNSKRKASQSLTYLGA